MIPMNTIPSFNTFNPMFNTMNNLPWNSIWNTLPWNGFHGVQTGLPFGGFSPITSPISSPITSPVNGLFNTMPFGGFNGLTGFNPINSVVPFNTLNSFGGFHGLNTVSPISPISTLGQTPWNWNTTVPFNTVGGFNTLNGFGGMPFTTPNFLSPINSLGGAFQNVVPTFGMNSLFSPVVPTFGGATTPWNIWNGLNTTVPFNTTIPSFNGMNTVPFGVQTGAPFVNGFNGQNVPTGFGQGFGVGYNPNYTQGVTPGYTQQGVNAGLCRDAA